MFMTTDFHYDVAVQKRDGKPRLILKYKMSRMEHTAKEIPLESAVVYLKAQGNKDVYSFLYSTDGVQYDPLGEMDAAFLSSETAGGFTGVYLALYAQGKQNGGYADFDWFEYAKTK